MTIAENKALAQRYFTEFDRQNFDGIAKLLTPGELAHLPGAPPLDWPAHVQYASAFQQAFPDLRHVIEDQLADAHQVVSRLTVTGTQTGPLMGIPASGRPIRMEGIAWFRIEDGRIAEEWTEFDRLGMLIQLGAAPPPPASASSLPVPTPDAPETLPPLADAAAVVRRWFERVDRGGVPDAAQYVGASYQDHNPPPFPGLGRGLDAVHQAFPVALVAFGEFHHELAAQVSEGDRVASRVAGYGRHTGDFLGVPPTGREVHMTGISIHRVAGGKLVEHWAQIDAMSLFQQLGVIPS